MVYKFFDKKTSGSGINLDAKPVRRTYANNDKLASELHKPVIKNL